MVLIAGLLFINNLMLLYCIFRSVTNVVSVYDLKCSALSSSIMYVIFYGVASVHVISSCVTSFSAF